MSKTRRSPQRGPESEVPDLTGGLTDEDLDEMEKDSAFQRMADEVDEAERNGEPTIPHEEVMRQLRRNRRR